MDYLQNLFDGVSHFFTCTCTTASLQPTHVLSVMTPPTERTVQWSGVLHFETVVSQYCVMYYWYWSQMYCTLIVHRWGSAAVIRIELWTGSRHHWYIIIKGQGEQLPMILVSDRLHVLAWSNVESPRSSVEEYRFPFSPRSSTLR